MALLLLSAGRSGKAATNQVLSGWHQNLRHYWLALRPTFLEDNALPQAHQELDGSLSIEVRYRGSERCSQQLRRIEKQVSFKSKRPLQEMLGLMLSQHMSSCQVLVGPMKVTCLFAEARPKQQLVQRLHTRLKCRGERRNETGWHYRHLVCIELPAKWHVGCTVNVPH